MIRKVDHHHSQKKTHYHLLYLYIPTFHFDVAILFALKNSEQREKVLNIAGLNISDCHAFREKQKHLLFKVS